MAGDIGGRDQAITQIPISAIAVLLVISFLYMVRRLKRDINSYIVDDKATDNEILSSKLFRVYYNGISINREDPDVISAMERVREFSKLAQNRMENRKQILFVYVLWLLPIILVIPVILDPVEAIEITLGDFSEHENKTIWLIVWQTVQIFHIYIFLGIAFWISLYITFIYVFKYLNPQLPQLKTKQIEELASQQNSFLLTFSKHTLNTFRRSTRGIVNTFLQWTIIYFAVMTLLNILLSYLADLNTAIIIAIDLVLFVFLLIGFIYPQLVPKRYIEQEKERLLVELEAIFSTRLDLYLKNNAESPDYVRSLTEELNFLNTMSEKVDGTLVWPISYSQIIALGLSGLGPILSLLWPFISSSLGFQLF